MKPTGRFTMTTINVIEEDNPFLVPLDSPSHEVQIKTTIRDMLAFAKDIAVNSEVSYNKITSMYRQAREWKKSIEAKRKDLVDPFRKQMAIINDKAKDLTDPLDAVIAIANVKSTVYLRMLEEAKKKEDEELRKVASIFDAEDEIYIPPMEKNIRGDGAVLVTTKEKAFRVLDISKVPSKYLVVDEKAIERDLKLGIAEISGLDIFETTKTQLRTR
jgi:hypothetical protein